MFDYTFILTHLPTKPVGGFKIAYQYANELAKRGYKVRLLYALYSMGSSEILKTRAKHYIKRRIFGRSPKWFRIRDDIAVEFIDTQEAMRRITGSLVYIATAYQTASVARDICMEQRAIGLYLIQAIENWAPSPQHLNDTYRMGLLNVAISESVMRHVQSSGARCFKCPNGLDENEFFMDIPMLLRKRERIMFMYHESEYKGSRRIINVLDRMNLLGGSVAFGAYRLPKDLRGRFEYHYKPDVNLLRTLYNSSSIFVSASENEGWGLPVSEAMMCGCSVVVSDIEGHSEFVIDGSNSLTFPTSDSSAMELCIRKLMANDELRLELSNAGLKTMRRFKIPVAVDCLESIVLLEKEGLQS